MIAILLILLVSTALCAGIVVVVCCRAYIGEYQKRALLKAHNAQLLADYMAQIEFTRQLTVQRDELALLGGEAVKELTQLRTRHEGLRRAYTQEEQRSKEIELRQRLAEGWFHLPSRQPHLFEN